jgi:hypothetical protein
LATDRASLASGSNAIIFAIISGQKQPQARPAIVSDVRDVARVQVGAMDETKVQGNRGIFTDAGKLSFDDANEIIKKNFPNAVSDGTFTLGGSIASAYLSIEDSESVRLFGPMHSYEEAIKSLLTQYLALESRN